MSRSTEVLIDTAALKSNYARAKTLAGGAKAFAVVKANAYGHGVKEAVTALREADGFAVAITQEASEISDQVAKKPLLVLEGPLDIEDLREIIRIGAHVVVHTEEQVQWIEQYAGGARLDVWIKVDTGMSRLGFQPAQLAAIIKRCQHCDNINAISLMTHMACADEKGHDLNEKQRETFKRVVAPYAFPISMANSAGIIGGAAIVGDWVRPGIMLYGSNPMQDSDAEDAGLKPVMTFIAPIIAMRTLSAGQSVGYGATWKATRESRIATVAVGYADGYPRHAENGTPVLVDGHLGSLVGRVSMDMITVDVTDIPSARLGSKATLWGDGLSVDDVAAHANTIAYQLTCAISKRVRRKVV